MRLTTGSLMSVDTECLTALPDTPNADERTRVLTSLLEEVARLVPCLPGPSGVFTGWGRVYDDGGHIELAAVECSSPYEVPHALGSLQRIVATAVNRLRERGPRVLLGTCTHGGRLTPSTPSWGAHENYLVGVDPRLLAERALPFLVTRYQAGSGAIWAPTCEYVASARLSALSTDIGGSTRDQRAIFSTARLEHHAGDKPGHYRCHLILGDGHRSQISLALHLGSTALVLRAIEAMPQGLSPLPRRNWPDPPGFWLAAARELNRLSADGGPPRVHPLAQDVQDFHAEFVERFVDHLEDPPAWSHRFLNDWAETRDRVRKNDVDWLSSRLDPWIKHTLITAWLKDRKATWSDLPRHPDWLDELALLDQEYHVFAGGRDLFGNLETLGLLHHQVDQGGPRTTWPESVVPDLATRAKPRARFIQAHSGQHGFIVDWGGVVDLFQRTRHLLGDPFALEFELSPIE